MVPVHALLWFTEVRQRFGLLDLIQQCAIQNKRWREVTHNNLTDCATFFCRCPLRSIAQLKRAQRKGSLHHFYNMPQTSIGFPPFHSIHEMCFCCHADGRDRDNSVDFRKMVVHGTKQNYEICQIQDLVADFRCKTIQLNTETFKYFVHKIHEFCSSLSGGRG